MNEAETNRQIVKQQNERKSLCVVISKHGNIYGPFDSAQAAGEFANARWPDQKQDENRTGKGWDVETLWPPDSKGKNDGLA